MRRKGEASPPHASRLTPQPRAIGILGGTFDPIHYGHLRMAEELAEALDIDQVRLIPAGSPPHRGQPRAASLHRMEMARRAVAGNPRFLLDDREILRDRPSYSVDTLIDLRSELPLGAPLVLFMGSDAFLGLSTWHAWEKLFDLAHIAVAHRPGFSPTLWEDALPDALRRQLARRRCDLPGELAELPAGRIHLSCITQLEISASQIRDLCLRGRSTRYLLPDPVIDYIHEKQLYV
ncbi:MAG: nicotinate-nucleotide adenylyltransferase [Thiobacillaceae bacterium]|nr:nicotinate-nucleotide adenylyltransferase [Thiobacillaceae bacterium]